MRRAHIFRASALTAVLISTSGCAALAILTPASRGGSFSGGGTGCSGWAAASAPGGTQSGEQTALAAVQKAAAEQNEPRDGWVATTSGPEGTFSSGTHTIHVQHLPDGTWIADSGSSCGDAPTATASATPVPAP